MTDIVTVNVSQDQAPTPSTLQRTGAFISQGDTTLTSGSTALITELADLLVLLKGAIQIQALTWAAGVVTITTIGAFFPENGNYDLTISGASPAAYNGTFLCSVTSTTQATFPLVNNPGAASTVGFCSQEGAADLVAMATTFFTQGGSLSVYVLELGTVGSAAQGVVVLSQWLPNHLGEIYAFLCPREWGAEPTMPALVAAYSGTTSKTYFHVTTTLGGYSQFTTLMKAAILTVEAPGVPPSEFSAAAGFFKALSYDPSPTNRATPFNYSFLYGVTPYPTKGNGPVLAGLRAAGVNVVGTGAEGGISTAMLVGGTTADKRDFTYWLAADWAQINTKLDVANAVINGSNDPQAPLYYDQPGIDFLRLVAQGTIKRGISCGLILNDPASPAIVQAVAFDAYVRLNPGDFKIGKYNGLGVRLTPNRGFDSIVFNIEVTDFLIGA